MIRVLLVDDETLVRQGIRLVLESVDDITVVGEAADGSDIGHLVRLHRPDIAVIDVNMPRVDGLTAIRGMAQMPGRPRVVMLTAHALDDHLYAALSAGADGFILKDVAPQELIAAIRTVVAGDALISPAMTRGLIERYTHSTSARGGQARERIRFLTPGQRYLLALIAHGMSNARIGQSLGMTESRVKAEVSHLLKVLDLSNRVQAATLACTAGLLDQPLGPPPHAA
ncbi:response regulator [Streptomyces sp. HD]|uniref:response regulator n=1 Tax=Streptomyces sp. HD TaxID=3020892 RepID=UPI00232E3CCD|nr:response regulator transcription factor [Streptomyces sp. HD]MDC0768722.1 response regulator transcription factor [Streptomyces sp. HD]